MHLCNTSAIAVTTRDPTNGPCAEFRTAKDGQMGGDAAKHSGH